MQTNQSADDYSYQSTNDSGTINCDVAKNINETKDTDIIVDIITDNDKNSVTINTIDNEAQLYCNIRENWRGFVRESPDEQCSPKKLHKKPTYLDKCPEWNYIKLARDQNIPIHTER